MKKLKYRLLKATPDLGFATSGSAGIDLYTPMSFDLNPFQPRKIALGVEVEIPKNHVGYIMSRSSFNALGIMSMTGVIDSDYRGEISCVLINLVPTKIIHIAIWSRIAQLIISPYAKVSLIKTTKLSKTLRGKNGFGSTGI